MDAIRYMRDPEAQLDGPRPEDLVAWDRICEGRRFVAIGGLDAHQHGIRVRGRLWSPMRNARYFAILSTYVSLTEPPQGGEPARGTSSSSTTRSARGAATSRSTRSLPAAASASGASPTGAHAVMGEERPAGAWTLRASLPGGGTHHAHAKRRAIAEAEGAALEHEVTEPGAYRIEAHRHWRKRERPWIYSNPIYLR